MAEVGAPKGNQNAKKAKIWTAAIERALEKRSKAAFDEIDRLAEKLLDQCAEGDLQALKELGDRLEGKPGQSVVVGGDSENPVVTEIRRIIVNAEHKDS